MMTSGGFGDRRERICAALRGVEDWPVPHVSVGAVVGGQTILHGDPERRFPWASVTKVITAVAVLVAVEEGTVSLDEPAGPPGSTVRHLLAHASGLPPGTFAPRSGSAPPGTFAPRSGSAPSGPSRATTSPPNLAPPGTRRIYSNVGYEVLASHLALRAHLDFVTYLVDGVLEPLGMEDVVLEGSPASGATGSISDLVALGSELVNPHLLALSTVEEATSVAFPGLAGVLPGYGRQDPNDWGLGFEIRDAKSPHWTGLANSPLTFGHFGQSGSFLWVDPVASVVAAVLTDRPFGPWAAEAWPRLSDAILEAAVSATP